ncbi:MAG: hypothetical protein HUU19_01440 [Phycisphaerales bacterium]|nr:hypothetical protein [Phycisphaerales bacterium]
MPTTQIRGRIVHVPGPWGASVPVRGLTVKAYDIDAGDPDDLIWQGTTDSNGDFGGQSSEWKDRIRIPRPFPLPPAMVENPTDLLLLRLEISDGSTTIPYTPFLSNSPIPVVWPVPPAPCVLVNGEVCNSPVDVKQKVIARTQQRSGITIELSGPVAAYLWSIRLRGTELKQALEAARPDLTGFINPWGADDVAALVVAIAILCFAVGVSTFVVCVGIAIIIMVAKNYRFDDISFEGNPATGTAKITIRSSPT